MLLSFQAVISRPISFVLCLSDSELVEAVAPGAFLRRGAQSGAAGWTPPLGVAQRGRCWGGGGWCGSMTRKNGGIKHYNYRMFVGFWHESGMSWWPRGYTIVSKRLGVDKRFVGVLKHPASQPTGHASKDGFKVYNQEYRSVIVVPTIGMTTAMN